MNNTPDCILFHCARQSVTTPIITMGLWGLADLLAQHGFETQIIHTGLEAQAHDGFSVNDYVHSNLLVAGCSAHWFSMMAESLDVLQQVKAACPTAFTVLGGYSASYFAREIMDNYPWVDGVIRGDGEKPLLALSSHLRTGDRGLGDVPNLVWRNGGGVTENAFAYVSAGEDVAGVAYGNYARYLHDYERHKEAYRACGAIPANFTSPDMPNREPFFLFTGKGCVNNCSICGGGAAAQKRINNRTRPLFLSDEHIVRTVKQAVDHGYRDVYVCFDPVPSRPHYLGYLRAIREAQLDVGLVFGFWRLPTPEVIREFKQTSHRLLVDISPESISERVRQVTKAGFHYSNQELYDAMDLLYAEHVYGHVYFGYFLPTETLADLEATRRAVWEINTRYPHYIEAHYILISTDPGAPLYVTPETYDTTLLIHNLAEHLAAGRAVTDSNIMVHSINSISPADQARFHRQMLFDGCIKGVFGYLVKYLVRAFPSADAFVTFLDGFYDAYGLCERDPHTAQLVDLLRDLQTYAADSAAQQPGAAAGYLVDLVAYVRQYCMTLAKSPPAMEGHGAAMAGQTAYRAALVPRLADAVTLVPLKHDIYRANEHLLKQRQFSDIALRTNWLAFRKEAKLVSVFEINESLYDLLSRCEVNTRRTAREIIDEIAELYTDDAQMREHIATDLHLAINQLLQGGILEIVDAFD